MKKVFKNNKGFTLTELMIAITIFSIISLFVVDIFIELSKSYYSSLSNRAAQQNIKFSMETVTRYVKQSTIADWNDSSKILRLKVKEGGAINDIVIGWDQPVYGPDGYPTSVGRLKMGTNVATPTQFITSDDANITNFDITHRIGIPPMVRIQLTAQIIEGGDNSLERGISSGSGIDMLNLDTTVALKAQYNNY